MRAQRFTAKAAVLALSAAALSGIATAPAQASAAGCLIGVSPVLTVHIVDQQVGTFYEGYDQCSNQAYAEFHFLDPSFANSLWGTSITISKSGGGGAVNTKNPGYTNWWDSPKYGASGITYTASFQFHWNIGSGGLHGNCTGWTSYNYKSGAKDSSELHGYPSCG